MNKDEGPSSLESNINDISVVEVYDLASDIGRECEKIIDEFGPQAVAQLIPKVINALEKLECLASQNERENSVLEELNHKIHCLETEKSEKAEYRKRFDKVGGTINLCDMFFSYRLVFSLCFMFFIIKHPFFSTAAVIVIDCFHFITLSYTI